MKMEIGSLLSSNTNFQILLAGESHSPKIDPIEATKAALKITGLDELPTSRPGGHEARDGYYFLETLAALADR